MKRFIHIDALTVVRKFGYLIADKGSFSGLEFALTIIKSGKDCKSHREACASSVASTVFDVRICGGKCFIKEILL